ncbi:hypothetical protein BJP34_27110 [Moorena producens PAL-8-15-08-1]|uniref:Uncharacterized protein n=1 Tax=Moorena producens PAL-8-15-08-1 TaxID=1458985 RepID=A0A1D8TYL0_9CYAN|nr:hypothetical protein BJP34_27110 [Moorena producens PAL-8-15-08-1]
MELSAHAVCHRLEACATQGIGNGAIPCAQRYILDKKQFISFIYQQLCLNKTHKSVLSVVSGSYQEGK